jgi:type IV pilus assembly protein PilE
MSVGRPIRSRGFKNLRVARGFNLIELMMVVAIMIVLTALALPSLRQYVARGHRADAQQQMQWAAQALEREFTLTSSFGSTIAANLATVPPNATGTNVRYNITLPVAIAAAPGTPITTYTLTATPVNAQVGDPCGVMTLSHTGVRTPLEAAVPNQACWPQ